MRDLLQEMQFVFSHGAERTELYPDLLDDNELSPLRSGRWRDRKNEHEWAEEDYGGISSHTRKATLPVGENWNPVRF